MDDYISKPIEEHLLVATIERWLPHAALEKIRIRAKEGIEDLIPAYLSNRQQDLLALGEALQKDDLATARAIGHGMKGSGGGYGFEVIGEIGRGIEECANARDSEGIRRQIANLREYLARLEIVY